MTASFFSGVAIVATTAQTCFAVSGEITLAVDSFLYCVSYGKII
jgi:hypothetical protein